MSNTNSLSTIDNAVQLRLRNTVGSPLSQGTRVEAYNRVLDYMQSKAHWNFTRKRAYFEYLPQETDYSIVNNLGLSDFKAYEDLRFINTSQIKHYREFEEIDGNDFAVLAGRTVPDNYVNFEERNGDVIMRVLSSVSSGKTRVDGMESLSTGRTWASDTSTSDATTLAVDTDRAKSGSCLKFDIDVSQSSNDYAQIYTSTVFTTSIDGSDVENFGHFRFWLGLHSMTSTNLALITGVTFVWGSDDSATPATKANYWSLEVDAPADGGDFLATWNRMDFDWSQATQTGSPDSSDLEYFEIRITYSSGMTDTLNIRVDNIDMYDPVEAELVYFSDYMVQSSSNVWQSRFTTGTVDTTELLLLPDRHTEMFINLALMELYPQQERNNQDYMRVASLAQEQLALAIQQDGNPITREKYEFEVKGLSTNRIDNTYLQW